MTTATRTNREVLDLFAAAKNRQDVAEALTFTSEGVTIEIPAYDSVGRGRAEVEALWRHFFELFPDYAVSLDMLYDEPETGDILAQGTVSLTMTGDFKGYKPNGKRATVHAFMRFSFANGQLTHELFHFDFGTICRVSGVPLEAAVEAITANAPWSSL